MVSHQWAAIRDAFLPVHLLTVPLVPCLSPPPLGWPVGDSGGLRRRVLGLVSHGQPVHFSFAPRSRRQSFPGLRSQTRNISTLNVTANLRSGASFRGNLLMPSHLIESCRRARRGAFKESMQIASRIIRTTPPPPPRSFP